MADRGSTIVTQPNARTDTATRSDESLRSSNAEMIKPIRAATTIAGSASATSWATGPRSRTRNHSHGIAAANTTHIAPFASDPTLISQASASPFLRRRQRHARLPPTRRVAPRSGSDRTSRFSVPAGTHVSGWVFGGEDMVECIGTRQPSSAVPSAKFPAGASGPRR